MSDDQERRRAPRLTTRLKVKSNAVVLHTTNISQSGAQVLCPEMMEDVLRRHIIEDQLNIEIHFSNTESSIITCNVVYISEVGAHSAVGLHFIAFENNSDQHLFTYLTEKGGSDFIL